jgi:TonB-linked SusC/RagA family outer membrane protein
MIENFTKQNIVDHDPMHNSIYRNLMCLVFFMLCTLSVCAQKLTVSGVVRDESGNVLPGVNVLEKGTTNGTSTSADGQYKIEIGSGSSTLVFSFIGYATQEILPGVQTVINISLTPDVTSLQEVVVVGYGSEKRSDLTGAVSSVKTAEMTKVATNDVTQMLQGRVAGVAVNSDGQPGATPSVKIRGIASFGTNGTSTEPLYVVDGVPLQGGIRDFNPNDIESMQVLKDASAGAIYGSRAANGVIIITTKRGAKDRPLTIDFNSYYGIQQVAKKIPVTDRVGYQLLQNETRANNATGPLPPMPGNDPNSPDFIDDVDTDWQKEGFKTGTIQEHTLNFAGGSKTSTYNLSLDYFKNTGTLVGNGPNYTRYSARINSETQRGIFKIGESMYLVHSHENPLYLLPELAGGRPSYVNDMVLAIPTMPVYDPARKGGFGGTDAVIQNAISLNVPGINTLVENETDVTRIFADTYAEVRLLKNSTSQLTYKINLGYDYTLAKDHQFVPQYDLGYFFPNANARASSGIRQYTTALVENTLNYEATLGKHALKLLAGQTYQSFDTYTLGGTTSQLREPYIPTLSNGDGTKAVTENLDKAGLYSFLGRINYTYDDKYILTANVRRDGSSRISPANRYQVYPSVAVAWKLHNEKFITFPEFIAELKLRASWGQVGNQGIPSYSYQAVINQNIPYSFGGATSALGGASTILVDPNLKWEKRTTRNVGIDAVLFDGKLDFTFEYYSNLASDILVNAPVPSSTGSLPTGTGGAASVLTNAGGMQNSGFELSFTYRKSVGDFTFEISPNAYTLRNRVTALNNDRAFLPGAGSRTQVGGEIGRHYGWVAEGIFQTPEEVTSHAFQNAATAPGDMKFKDLDGNNIIDDNDRQYLGKALPNLYYGLNITSKFKNFDLTIFTSGSSGNLINDNLYRALMSGNSYANYHQDLFNRWTPTHTNTDIPRMVLLDPNSNGRDSNRAGWLESANYLRINTVSLGYTLPSGTIKAITNARVYFTCQNLYTFSGYKGFNPDFTAGLLNPGFDFGTYPKPRTYMLGIQLRF